MIKNVFRNKLIDLGFFNSFSIVIKIVAGIVSSKALAIFIGPSGLGVLGVFKEFFNMIMNVSSLGLQKGIVKYTAELKSNKKELKVFISTIMLLGSIVSVIFGCVIFIFSKDINNYLFSDYNFTIVIKMLAFILPVSVLSNFWLYVLTGLGYPKKIIRINSLLYVLNMVAIIVLSYKYNALGAFIGISIIYVLQLITIIIFDPREKLFKLNDSIIFSNRYLKKILGYTLMTLISLVLFPVISILIREEIINLLGETSAGFWEAMKRISENYLLFVSSLIMLFVLPKLSENESGENFRDVVFDFLKSIIPFFVLGLLLIYILKNYIISLFYSKEFLPMYTLFKWYVLGDFFRVLGMVLAANFFARRHILGYILTDVFLALIMYFTTVLLLKNYGLNGGGIAYFVSYLLYFILLLLIFGRKLFLNKTQRV